MTPEQAKTKHQAEVMLAYAEGKTIQARSTLYDDEWGDCAEPVWAWNTNEYRVKPDEQKKIKLLAWLNGTLLMWATEGSSAVGLYWVRIPSEDKEVLL